MSAEILDRSSILRTGSVACSRSSNTGGRYSSDTVFRVREMLGKQFIRIPSIYCTEQGQISSVSKRRGWKLLQAVMQKVLRFENC